MLRALVPTAVGNAAIDDGSMPKALEELVARLQPEAVYFFPDQGRRSFMMVFDLADTSAMPPTVEPIFRALQAEITLTPVMNLDDLRSGLATLAAA